MAKKTKTKKKKEEEEVPVEKSEAEAVKDIVEELIEDLKSISSSPPGAGIVSVHFTKEELATFASLMSICAQTFEQLAIQAAAENDDNASTVLSARHKLSNMYAARLIESFSVGEPESRDIH